MATTITERRGPYGSSNPSNWILKLGPHEEIRGVNIRYGDIVDAIQFIVAGQNERTTTRLFGGEGGSYHQILFKENEYMTKISGSHGRYDNEYLVASIKIHTNLLPNGYGPYGMDDRCLRPVEFSISLPSSASDLVGFIGRHGRYLQSIGAYIKRTIRKHGPWGSRYPPNWNLELDPRETIKEVHVRSGWIVDGIEFIIEDRNGTTTTKRFGGRGGGRYEKIQLGVDEHITNIGGTYGVYEENGHWHLASIKIHTNLKPNGYGPYGEQTRCKDLHGFSSSIPPGCVIVGFFGRAQQYVDCIGVYTKTVD